MRIAISCLGMAILTQHDMQSWQGYLQLRYAELYAGLLAESMRESLAVKTFLQALQERDRNIRKRMRKLERM